MNFPDTLIIENKCQVQPAPPFTPGDQAAGALKAVGEGVSHGEVLDAAAPPARGQPSACTARSSASVAH